MASASLAWTRSLRFRLTAWYTLALALVLTVAGLAAYLTASKIVLRETDGYLRVEALRISSAVTGEFESNGDSSELQETLDAVQGGTLASQPLPGFVLFEAMYGRVVEAGTGATVAISPNLKLKTDDIATLDEALRNTGHHLTFSGPDEERTLRVLTETLQVNGRSLILQLAVPWDQNQDALERFGASLCLWIPVVIAVAAIGGWVIVGRTLRPIGRIVAEAERADIRSLTGVLLPAPSETDSEVGRLVATLNGMAARMHQAFDAERRFAADASHELRTPLTYLRGEIEYTLLRPREPETYRAALLNALTGISEVGRIVESLSYLARLDSGEATSSQRSAVVDVSTLIAGLVQECEPEASQKSIVVTLTETPTAVRILGNEEQIRLMLRNLLNNAVKYTPEGGAITLAVGNVQVEGHDSVQIVVSDTGIGIAREEIEHVFDRFWRADRARSSIGTGLGLSIARQIAEAHGGTITVSSVVGQGSRFTVHLPAST